MYVPRRIEPAPLPLQTRGLALVPVKEGANPLVVLVLVLVAELEHPARVRQASASAIGAAILFNAIGLLVVSCIISPRDWP